MIRNFYSETAQDIFDGVDSRQSRRVPSELHAKISRLFDRLNAIESVEELRIPRSNRLEKLQGDLQGFWSIRINRQWRIVFRWYNGIASDVDVLDYH